MRPVSSTLLSTDARGKAQMVAAVGDSTDYRLSEAGGRGAYLRPLFVWGGGVFGGADMKGEGMGGW